jgi:hypothetical protein
MDDKEFHEGMKAFIAGWCKGEENKRRISDNIRRTNHEIGWLRNAIKELELKMVYKPSAIKQIRQYEHQILEAQVKLAFDPWYGATIQEMEND